MNKTVKILLVIISILIIFNIMLIYQISRSRALFHPDIVAMMRELPPELRGDLIKKIRTYRWKMNSKEKRKEWEKRRELFRRWREYIHSTQGKQLDQLHYYEKKLYDYLHQPDIRIDTVDAHLDSINRLKLLLAKEGIHYFIQIKDSLPPEEQEFLLRNMFRETKWKQKRRRR